MMSHRRAAFSYRNYHSGRCRKPNQIASFPASSDNAAMWGKCNPYLSAGLISAVILRLNL